MLRALTASCQSSPMSSSSARSACLWRRSASRCRRGLEPASLCSTPFICRPEAYCLRTRNRGTSGGRYRPRSLPGNDALRSGTRTSAAMPSVCSELRATALRGGAEVGVGAGRAVARDEVDVPGPPDLVRQRLPQEEELVEQAVEDRLDLAVLAPVAQQVAVGVERAPVVVAGAPVCAGASSRLPGRRARGRRRSRPVHRLRSARRSAAAARRPPDRSRPPPRAIGPPTRGRTPLRKHRRPGGRGARPAPFPGRAWRQSSTTPAAAAACLTAICALPSLSIQVPGAQTRFGWCALRRIEEDDRRHFH